MPESLILKNTQAPGDILMLSAAVRDLHRCYPGRFITGVDTSAGEIWQNNPYVTPNVNGRKLVLGYPLIGSSNQCGLHFINGFIHELNKKLTLKIRLTEFRADLHFSQEEKEQRPIPERYWLIVSGGKTDFTTKWWSAERFQQVVDELEDEVHFVQIGGKSDAAMKHVHPPLRKVHSLVGKTSLREALCLLLHADGIICPVTCFMHAAAAMGKPAVVIAGGREHWTWEAYTYETLKRNMAFNAGKVTYLPGEPAEWDSWEPSNDPVFHPHPFTPQTYLHSIGRLACSQSQGCWRTHVNEGKPDTNCLNVIQRVGRQPLPKCMDMITVADVVAAVRSYEDQRNEQLECSDAAAGG